MSVDYIIDSIKSKDNLFYDISNENIFLNFVYINGMKVKDDFFL